MPFTPSHAIVALPFRRRAGVAGALAVGAMAPDLPLFVRFIPLPYGVTHEWRWLPLTVVFAFLLLMLWRCVLRPAASQLVPRAVGERLPADWDASAAQSLRELVGSLRGFVVSVFALAVGILSHITWDAFTHVGRAGTRVLPVVGEMWGVLPGYKWLQHGSSVVGLIVLAVWLVQWWRAQSPHARSVPVAPSWLWIVWLGSLAVLLVGAWVCGLVLYGPITAGFTYQHLAYRMLPPACAVWGGITVVLCVMLQVRRNWAARDTPEGKHEFARTPGSA